MTPSVRRRAATAVAVVLACLLLAGCGLDEQEQRVADGVTTALSDGDDATDAQELAQCTAERWVGEAGLEPLRQDGLVSGEDADEAAVRAAADGQRPVSEPVARAYARARVSCLDYDAASSDVRAALPDASSEVRDDYADCLRQISDDLREDAITKRLQGQGGAEPVTRLRQQEDRCLERARS